MLIDKMTHAEVIEAATNHLRDLYFSSKVWTVYNESTEDAWLQFNITDNIKWVVTKKEGGWYFFQIFLETKKKKLQVSKENPSQWRDLITPSQKKRQLVDFLEALTLGTKVFLETSPLKENTTEDFRGPLVRRASVYLDGLAREVESEKEKKKAIEKQAWQESQAAKAVKDKSDRRKLWWIAAAVIFWLVVFVYGAGDGCYTTYDDELVCN